MIAAFAFGLMEKISMHSLAESDARPVFTPADMNFESSVGHVLREALPSLDVTLSRALKRDGISYRQWVILRALCELGTATATELARRFRYGTGSLSRLINRLARRNLIQRLRTDGDRRVVVLSPTLLGTALVHSTLPRVAQTWKGILCRFETDEVYLLVKLLRRLEELDLNRPGAEEAEPPAP